MSPHTNPEAAGPDRDALLAEFLRTNREMIAAQREVMLAYLGGPSGGRLVWQDDAAALQAGGYQAPSYQSPGYQAAAYQPAPAYEAPAAAEQRPALEPAAEAPAPAGGNDGPADLLGTVLEIISARTGYPIDMIEPELDLEADLSVDSIKRTEIAGELAQRLDLGAADLDDDQLEQMAKARTARAIADWLTQHSAGGAADSAAPGGAADAGVNTASATPEPAAPAVTPAPAPSAAADTQPVPDIRAPKRLEEREVEAALPEHPEFGSVAGKRFALLGTEGLAPLADALTAALAEHGATATVANVTAETEGADGVIHLGGLSTGEQPLLPDAFGDVKSALAGAPQWFLAVRALDEHGPAVGLRGLMRTVEREYPETLARLVEVAPDAPAAELAATIAAELASDDRHAVTLHRDGVRLRPEPVEVSLGALAANGAGPAGDGVAEAKALELDRDSVVVIVGGARGITARIATTLAGAARCRVELIGRTPLPSEPESAVTASAKDASSIRAALIQSGMRSPAEIERTVNATLAAREVASTLGKLRDLGAEPRYHALDVRDGEALGGLLKAIHVEHGRLDGVLYAAGIIEDKVIAEKNPESFARVYGTKADGVRALFSGLDQLQNPPRFCVLFGSIAAVLGNRGQSDYAAANDALQSLGAQWSARSGARCVTVHWGPWAPAGEHGGMVSPELMQTYAKRGIALIDPEEGALALLRELAWGRAGSVVYTASGW